MLGDLAIYNYPQLSPDGKRLTVSIVDPRTGNEDVWLFDSGRDIKLRDAETLRPNRVEQLQLVTGEPFAFQTPPSEFSHLFSGMS